jgi:ABC-type polysaccharide/polyol phosphate transport system ATPase subunit
MPVRTYSSGMFLRCFRHLDCDPTRHSVMDELINAGDASFVEKPERLEG